MTASSGGGATPPAPTTTRLRFISRPTAVLLVAFVIGAAFYGWTVATAGARASFNGDLLDYYGMLTSAFLHGHLYLQTPVPHGLLALHDPFDPSVNSQWQSVFHDLAVYHGRFYVDWGPTPVLTLYLPWRLLGLGSIAEPWALWIYSTIGLRAALALLRCVQRRFVPNARTSRIAWCAIALIFSTVVPFIDRTPDVYEVAVASAYCFAMLGCYLLARGGLVGPISRWRLALGSLSLGLAAGGRWDLLFAVVLLPLLLVRLFRRVPVIGWRERVGLATWVLGPGALVVLGLLVYNVARFGSPLEVGTSYQLAGFDPTKTPYYLLGYLWPSLYYYVIAPFRLSLVFPFVWLPPPPAYPGAVPVTYAPEMIGGVLPTVPILLAWIPLVAAARRVAREWWTAAFALALVVALVVVLLALGVPGGSMRYEVDFVPFLLLPALLVFLSLEPRRRWFRRVVGAFGAFLIACGALVGCAISISGYHDQIVSTDSGQVSAMKSATSPVVHLVVQFLNHPVLVSGGCDGGFISSGRYTTLGIGDVLYGVVGTGNCTLTVLAPRAGTWNLSFAAAQTPNVGSDRHIIATLTDATGHHRYSYPGGNASITWPLHLRGGSNTVTITAEAPGRPALAPNTGLFSFSGLKVAGLSNS